MIYADEEALLPDGAVKLLEKPDWSPDTLRSCNYIGSPFAAGDTLCAAVGMPRGNDFYERYRFLLEAATRINRAHHISKPLYAGPVEQPENGQEALRQIVTQNMPGALVLPGQLDGSFCLRYPVAMETRVSAIVIAGDNVEAVRTTLESVACQNTYQNLALMVCDGSPIGQRKEAYYAALKGFGAAKIVRIYDEPNVPKLCNCAAEQADGDALLFLPAGVELAGHDTVERMLEYVQLPHIGCVGGLESKDGRFAPGIIHNATAIEGPMMVESDFFFAQAGFDVTFERAGYIKAFALLAAALGRYNLITPYARFVSPKQRQTPKPTEKNKLRIQDMEFARLGTLG